MIPVKIEAGAILPSDPQAARAYRQELDDLRALLPAGAKVFDTGQGGRIVEIPLGGDKGAGLRATLTPAQWRHLRTEKGVDGPLYLNSNGSGVAYVRASQRLPDGRGRRLVTLARLLTGAGVRDRINYRDGNYLNLRPDNLEVVPIQRRKLKPGEAAAAAEIENLRRQGLVVDPLRTA